MIFFLIVIFDLQFSKQLVAYGELLDMLVGVIHNCILNINFTLGVTFENTTSILRLYIYLYYIVNGIIYIEKQIKECFKRLLAMESKKLFE